MKTWHKYWQDQLSINLIAKIICGMLLLAHPALSKSPPTLFESLNLLNEIDRTRYKSLSDDISKQKRYLKDIMDKEGIQLEQSYLVSILYNTPPAFAKLLKNNECAFYDLLAAGLLQDASGEVKEVIIKIDGKDKIKELAKISKETYLQYFWARECENGNKARELFKTANLPNTLKEIDLPLPQNKPQCIADLNGLISDIKTPYLCGLTADAVKGQKAAKEMMQFEKGDPKRLPLKRIMIRGKVIETLIKPDTLQMLTQMCSNFNNQERFCEIYLRDTAWDQMSKENAITKKYCGEKKDKKELKKCLRDLKKDYSQCFIPKTDGATLTPQPNCQTQSSILLASNIPWLYEDCPGKLGNEGVVNLSRVITNFRPPQKKIDNCEAHALTPWWELMDLANNEKSWPMSICYDRKASGEKECLRIFYNSFMGRHSLVNVFERILKDNRKIDQGAKCEFLSDKKYNPNLLEYKVGCYLVYSNNECSSTECQFKVILNTKEFKGYELIREHSFQYFPVIRTKRSYAQNLIIERGLQTESKPIDNLSAIRFHLKQHEKVAIHGIGCAEFLMPSFFQMKSLGQCTPLPFEIIKLMSDEQLPSIAIQMSIDDQLTPRIITWRYLLQAVKRYQKHHPLNQWSLHAMF